MQPQERGVHYSRWDDSSRDEVSMTSESNGEESSSRRIFQTFCTGKLGVVLKVLGTMTLFWTIFTLGYVTGYYVHKCK
ncbi:small integral membrane protein 1 isoform 2-T8 [Thomomys bottae]